MKNALPTSAVILVETPFVQIMHSVFLKINSQFANATLDTEVIHLLDAFEWSASVIMSVINFNFVITVNAGKLAVNVV